MVSGQVANVMDIRDKYNKGTSRLLVTLSPWEQVWVLAHDCHSDLT